MNYITDRIINHKKQKKPKSFDFEENALGKLKALMDIKEPEKEIEKNKNHIYFYTDVTQESCNELTQNINDLNKELLKYSIDYDCPPPSIFLHINSLGGDLLSAFGVVDTIQTSRIPIVSIIQGQAASAATIISMSCHKRYMTKNSFMLIHQLSNGCYGKFEEIKDDFENDTTFMETLYSLYQEHTTMNLKKIKKALKHDLWWNLDKCIENGLVDEVWTPHLTTVIVENMFHTGKEYKSNTLENPKKKQKTISKSKK